MRAQVVARLRAAGCVWAEDEADVLLDDSPPPDVLESRVARRCAGEPLELVVGWAAFGGLRLAVAPGVFVPRRRSELMVSVACALPLGPSPVVVDLGCGTGALGAAVAAGVDLPVELHAVDVDPAAVACAATNLPAAARLYCGSLFDPLPVSLRGRVRLVLANAPYVPSGELDLLPAEARGFEHHVALDGGPDGLDVHRRIAAGVGDWLAPGATLLIEIGEAQRDAAEALLHAAGLHVIAHRDADLDALVLAALVPA